MSLVRLKYIHSYVDRHGARRTYFRRKGAKQIPLPGKIGSEEFMRAYNQALLGAETPSPIGAGRVKAGTIEALIVSYYQSSRFVLLAAPTKTTYRGILERFRSEYGQLDFARLEARHVRAILDKKAHTPVAANRLLFLIRLLMRHAIERELLREDPTRYIGKVKFKTDGFRQWAEEDIEKFKVHWPLGTRAHLALMLLLHTAQRRADVIRMGRQHVIDGWIHVTQQKTGTALKLWMVPELRAAIDACPTAHCTYLMTAQGKPFTAPGFTNWFVDCARQAGLPKGCAPHGLRKAAARRFG